MKKIIAICTILLILVGCNKQENIISRNLFYMDTLINIKLYNIDKEIANKAIDEIDKLYNKYQKLTDFYDENSELYQLNNHSSGEKVISISQELYNLIQEGLNWYKESSGLLNINIGELSKIWNDFRNGKIEFPNENLLNNVNIDITNIQLLDNNKIINTNPKIDLGAIAKGYVTELAGRYLEENGIEYYIINAGGNVKVGKSHKGYYTIGVASPINQNENFEILKAENISVVTSGSYERFYEYNGQLYHHIIDPNTKYPANYMKSVTVIGKDSGECDALSTILFLMDIDSGKEFIKDYNVDVIWFTQNNEIIKSDGFQYE